MKSCDTIVNTVLDGFFDGTEDKRHPQLTTALATDSEYLALRGLLVRAVELAREPLTVIVDGEERPLKYVLHAEAQIADMWAIHVGGRPAEKVDREAVAHNLGRFAETMRLAAGAVRLNGHQQAGNLGRGQSLVQLLVTDAVTAEEWKTYTNSAPVDEFDIRTVSEKLCHLAQTMRIAADAVQ